jgi:imidazoleglycerol phosphate synthase glutamine amidotransferase subunit HisH
MIGVIDIGSGNIPSVCSALKKNLERFKLCSNAKDLKNNESVEKRFPKLEYALTNYIEDFISHIWNGENLFACQFHPEFRSKPDVPHPLFRGFAQATQNYAKNK